MNIDNRTIGRVCDTVSADDSKESSSVFSAALSPLSPSIRSSSSLEVNHTVDHQPAVIKDSVPSHETVGLWRGNDVGAEAKVLFQAVECQYPKTFHGVQIRPKQYWLSILKGLNVVLKGFLETSVDALTDEQISSLQEDLSDFERSGFDLSWAHKRLDMVKNLKFGSDPLRRELVVLEVSLKSVKEELVEAEERLKKVRLNHDSVTDARNKKAREVADKFGDEYDRVLKGNLGFGMLLSSSIRNV